ncbi:Cellulose synthase operon protein YhjQ OS=Castellaniella defragrans OX=75697 GN=HNR28_002554 PE=4 SV=1 [Castellaniella defragrans]
MNLVTLVGLRGGAGTSTVVGMLGDALHAQGARVLMVDLNASDILRLHFNVPYSDGHGWVASLFPKAWRDEAYQVEDGLCLAPFGRKAIEESGLSHLLKGEDFWLQALPGLEEDFDWVLFDCPPLPHRMAAPLRFRSTLDVLVARPDVASHVLLAQVGLGVSSHLLINGFDPKLPLACDIVLDWRHRYGDRVLPDAVLLDESVNEALAFKTPVTRYMPDAASSQAARSLAQWCRDPAARLS